MQEGRGLGFYPPITDVVANSSDNYYGAMRESGKQIFGLNITNEELWFDFNKGVGDSIPAYGGIKVVTAIDSILLNGVMHRVQRTTDSLYYTIEGVGSSRGLIPALNDDGPDIEFHCYTRNDVLYSPDTAITCTHIYRIGFGLLAEATKEEAQIIKVYPNPASGSVHIEISKNISGTIKIINYLGQAVWNGNINGAADVPAGAWPQGIYFIFFASTMPGVVENYTVKFNVM